jgi:hypothetical protein
MAQQLDIKLLGLVHADFIKINKIIRTPHNNRCQKNKAYFASYDAEGIEIIPLN